ncbi:MAG: carboxypeptidase regulatory-like domain-containing protein [Bacteroidota bacterium]
MRLASLLCASLLLAGCGGSRLITDQPAPRAPLTGTLIELGTGDPVSAAEVRVGGTSLQAPSDSTGTFSFAEVPMGQHQLAIVMPGSGPYVEDIVVEADGAQVEVYLPRATEETPALDEANVAERLERVRDQIKTLQAELQRLEAQSGGSSEELELFRRLYLGTDRVDECRLINPEALTFSREQQSNREVITATALQPLRLENRYLGYEVEVVLESFSLTEGNRGYSLQHESVPYFEPLTPANEKETAGWERNRRRVYQGSLNHFLAAVAVDRTTREGYTVFGGSVMRQSTNLALGTERRPEPRVIDTSDYLREGEEPREQLLVLDREMKVQYLRAVDNTAAEFIGIAHGDETSWLGSSTGVLRFSPTGEVLNPQDLSVRGFWSIKPLCNRLPKDLGPVE